MAVSVDNKLVTGASIKKMKEYIDNRIDDVAPSSVKHSNRNLLDNPYFSVNQRGTASADSSANKIYGLDRWFGTYSIDNSAKTILMSGVQWFGQSFEEYSFMTSKTLTVSILYSDGVIDKGSFVFEGASVEKTYVDFSRMYLKFSPFWNGFQFVNHTSVTVKAVKLELGDKSTLAYDAPPNYATELLKCQRYFQYYYRLATSVMSNWSHDGVKYKANFNFPKMRTAPQFSFAESFAGMECPNRIFVPTANFTLTEVAETSASANVDASYAYIGNPYYLYKVSLSADL